MNERIQRVEDRLREEKWDALVCALPSNVLLLSGYWPIVGTSVAIATADGGLRLLVPEHEEDLAKRSWATEVQTFQAASLDDLHTAADSIEAPLSKLLHAGMTVGFEDAEESEPASYVAMNLYSGGMRGRLESAAPDAKLIRADSALSKLKSIKTRDEIAAIRKSARAAAEAFKEGAAFLKVGLAEVEAGAAFTHPLSTAGMLKHGGERAGGQVSCVSGKRSGNAFGAFARSTAKKIESGDLVLTHCNSQVDGYWTDITRTYSTGEFAARKQDMYSALFAARDAAFAALVPGVCASDVDAAARSVLEERGFGKQFKHATGHGVGFGAINAHAIPRLHPKSPDRIEPGMVFNVEPGIYFEDFGGMRQCEMVAMTDTGAEVLTGFQGRIEDLCI